MRENLKEFCYRLRERIEEMKTEIRERKKHPVMYEALSSERIADVGEINANLTLAFRHLENAHMRLGKAVQAYGGGKSCYKR